MTLEDLKEKINHIKDDLLVKVKSISFRKKSDEEEDDDDWEEVTEEVTEINPPEDLEDEEEDILDEDEAEVKKNRNIRIGLGVVAVLVLSSDYWLDPFLEKPAPKVVRKQRKVKKKPVEVIKKEESIKEKKVIDPVKAASNDKEIDQEIESEIKTIEATSETPKIEEVKAEDNVAELPAKIVELKTEPLQEDISLSQEEKEFSFDETESLGEQETQTKEEPKAKEKPIEKLGKDYIAPPNYSLLGRGLVYNCEEKFWACVGKVSYFQCAGNLDWSKKHNKPTQCYTKNVYANVKDCETVQAFYVNNNEVTDFCAVK